MLERVVDTPGWLGCDFHVHSEPSWDSNVTLSDRARSLAAEGVKFAAATDHNHVANFRPALRRAELASEVGSTIGVD